MWNAREAWILRLTDADGRIGVGEAVVEPGDGEMAVTVLEAAGPRSRSDGERRPAAVRRRAGVARAAGSGPPGGARRRAVRPRRRPVAGALADGDGIGVNATLPLLGPAPSAEAARQAVDAGFATLKLKAGAERETEVLVDRVRAVRQAIGPDVRLRLDVNGAWDPQTAVDRLEAVERFALEYVEQPLAGDDAEALAELRRRVRVPIAADETVDSVEPHASCSRPGPWTSSW